MSLLNRSVQSDLNEETLNADQNQGEWVFGLAGNPNVGKSTVFNALTGLNQHTGNWPGKTVTNAQGKFTYRNKQFVVVDLPGTYSILANSQEEEVARDFICYGNSNATVVVVDATALERNLNLVLQILELTPHVIVCINLMDEAKKKGIDINLGYLRLKLGVPVIATSARSNIGLDDLKQAMLASADAAETLPAYQVIYSDPIEERIAALTKQIAPIIEEHLDPRWVAIRLLCGDDSLLETMELTHHPHLLDNSTVMDYVHELQKQLEGEGIPLTVLRDRIITEIVDTAQHIVEHAIQFTNPDYLERDLKVDRLLTSKWFGIPLMILLLMGILWLTIAGANIPSDLLGKALFAVIPWLNQLFSALHLPELIRSLFVDGLYKTVAWVVSVMLPPMAIFFPLFTLLEDLGYLPRVAFNLDHAFEKAKAHGKQALTMCMGFGCNAAGVIGCRIIDSPRERLIAILTNNFVPCNGRFPTLIAIITIFFAGLAAGFVSSLTSVLILTGVLVLGILTTFWISRLLSETILKGIPSSFQLELPPYRRPQIGKVIVRSIFDRTLFVLGRAVMIAAPAGLVIWVMANISIADQSILMYCVNFLQPLGHLMGLDGYILIAFILGFPANEVVVPSLLMAYLSAGSLTEYASLGALRDLLLANNWTWITAICMLLFTLYHWPCGTTLMTIKKETKSWKWTILAFLIPTVIGIVVCIAVASTARMLGLA